MKIQKKSIIKMVELMLEYLLYYYLNVFLHFGANFQI
jgi:hypothetical protein